MKILMIYPLPSPASPQKNCALSIIYPGRAAEENSHDVEYWDARLDKEKDLWQLAQKADIFGISSMSGFQLGEAIRIAKALKKFNKPIVWGGVHATFMHEQLLLEDYCDYAVLGEGEIRFPKLLRAIERELSLESIDGIGFKKQEEIIVNPRKCAVDLKTQYVSAVSSKTQRLFIEAAKRNEVILQTSRGCPWSPTSCVFCSVGGQYATSVYRCIPYKLWAKDLRAIYSLEPFNFIELEDENSAYFLKDWRYAELLKSLKIKYHLHLRSDQLRNEMVIAKLAETGCRRVHIGAESGNQKTLDAMRKNEKVEDHYSAARLLAKYGLEGVYTWIIGNPGETPEQIMDTLRASDEIRAIHPQAKSRATIYLLMPLPGTISFEQAKASGWKPPKNNQEWVDLSAAGNPQLPQWMNNIYFIAGFHHNRYHKTPQNFPGWWRLLILPFEWLIELRWQLGIKNRKTFFFQFFWEKKLIKALLKWRSPKSGGQGKTHTPKLIERLLPGMAGH